MWANNFQPLVWPISVSRCTCWFSYSIYPSLFLSRLRLISSVQANYYLKQFLAYQPIPTEQLDSQTASRLFERSQLPRSELCHIWELADTDKDGKLTLTQFMLAFHLIVARKNNLKLPMLLPIRLYESGTQIIPGVRKKRPFTKYWNTKTIRVRKHWFASFELTNYKTRICYVIFKFVKR